MLLVKILGILDVFAGLVLLFTLGDIPFRLILGHSLYLILKGYIFKGDLLSQVDMIIGCYGLLAIFFPITFLSIIAGSYLFLKGIYSIR